MQVSVQRDHGVLVLPYAPLRAYLLVREETTGQGE